MKLKALFLLLVCQNTFGYNPEHVQQLIKTKKCRKCDLSNAHVQGHHFENADVEGSDLSHTNASGTLWNGSNLKNTKLYGTIFSSSILQDVDFSGAFALEAQFVNSLLHRSKFLGTILHGANFTFGTLHHTNFTGAKFKDTHMLRADLYHAKLHKTSGSIITDHKTSFCHTKMHDGSVKTEYSDYRCGHKEVEKHNNNIKNRRQK